MKDKVILIDSEDWQVIYYNGNKYDEGHKIPEDKYVRLGMLMMETNIDISDIIYIHINKDNISDESILWNWPNNIDELNDEIKELIMIEGKLTIE